MAEDILGISGQMDISDIQKSFDMLLNNLNQLGVKTDEVSSKMTKALNDIASSSVSDSSKTQQSIQTLKDGITEINKSLTDTPEALKKLAVEAQTAEATVDKLKKRLTETTEGSKEWTSINSQLSTQQQLVDKLNNEYSSMLGTFGNTQQYVGTLNAAIETLNAGRSISTATTGLSATAHLGAAAAVGTEAAAHGENAGKISDETVKLNENLDAQQKTIAAKEQNVSIISEEAEAIKNVTDRLQEGKVSEEEYLRVIENGSKVLENLQATRNEYVSKKAQAYENYQDAYNKGISGELTKEDATRTEHDYFTLFQEYGEKVKEVDERIRQLQESLNTLSSAYDKVQEAQQQQVHTASQAHQQEEEQSRKDVDAIKAKEEEIQRLKDEYSKLREQMPNFWGLGADINEQKTPFSTIIEWNKQTGELRLKISDAEAELEKMKNTTAEVKNATTEVKNEAAAITFGGEVATIEGVTKAIKLDEQELKQLKAEYANLKGAGEGSSDAAKQNLHAQKELNKHISEGRDVLKQLGTSYEDAAEGAKKTKEETKEVAKSADEVSKKVEGFATKLKKALGGAMTGDFSGLFSMFGKMAGWGVAIGALGKGLYELNQRAEEFRESLLPLSHYIDENRLEYVRNEILALSSTTTKSVSDMAGAATQFVKVWDGLRESPDALMEMVKSSNEFGALSGKSSEEAAKYLTNLASEYHMTALEATDASSMIATAAHTSTSTFGEMADALASAGTTASTYGVSFRDMATLIGYSANNFGGAQKAASKFSMLLMNMENQQNSQYKPSVVGMVQALQNMKVALDNGELSQKTFGSRVRATAKYFIENADVIAEYGKHIDSTKAKQEDLMDINARASVNVAKLQNAWDGLLTSFNANYTPILTKILNFFARIIGGAQKTAEELNYIKNFDKLHPKNKQKTIGYADEVTSGWTAGAEESVIVNLGAMQQYNMSKEEGWKNRQKQEKILSARYKNVYNHLRKKWKNASQDAILNATGNDLVRLFQSKRGTYNEFDAQSFNAWLRKQRNIYSALDKKTNNTGNGGNGGDFTQTNTDAEKTAEKQRQYREQQAEQQAKQIAEDEKLKWELYVAEQEAGIANEHDANEKELKQRKLDFEKKKHQIEEEAKQLRQKNIDAAKASYEKNPANKKKEGFYASGLDKGVTLTDDQQKLIDAKMELINVQQKEEEEKNLKTITDKYKDENQKRLDLEKQYNTDIEKIQKARADKEKELSEATTEEHKKKIQEQIDALILAEGQATKDKGEAIVGFDFEQLKKNPEYVAAFEDLNNVSSETLNHLIELFEKFKTKAAEDMKPDQLREYTKTLQQMQDELLGRENPFKQVASAKVEYDVSNDQVVALEKYIKALKTGKNVAEATNNVERKLGKTYATQEEAEQDLAKAKEKRNKAETKYLKSVKNLNTKINELASAISGLGDTIGGTEGQILGLIGSVLTFVTQTTDGIKTVAAAGTNAIATIEKASVILGIISAAIQLLQKMSSLYKDSHAQYEEYAEEIKQVNDLTNAVNEYKLAALEAAQAKEKWFTSTELTDLKQASEYNQQALESYIATLTEAQAIYQNESGGGWFTNGFKWIVGAVGTLVSLPGKLFSKGLEALGIDTDTWLGKLADWNVDAAFGGVEAVIGKGIASIVNGDNYSEGTTAAMNNLRIETRKKTHGIFGSGIGAKSQKTENLVDWAKEKGYGDLFDENGFIDTDIAQNIIDKFGDKLVGETKETLEELIKLKEEYDKFNEQLEEYVSDAFSPLTDDLTNALFDWLETGEDVMDKFKEYASDTFQDIAKSIVKTTVVSSLFGDYEDKIKELYKTYSLGVIDESTLWTNISDYTKTWMDKVETQVPKLQTFLKSMDEAFEGLGIAIDGTTQSEQEATTKAIEAITADQASSLIGIGYAMQIALEQGNEVRTTVSVDISSMRGYTEQISNNITEMRDIQYEGLGQLQQIVKNTAPITLIREDISSMYKLMKGRY